MPHIVLADRYNVRDVIEEEKEQWVITLLVMLGVPEDQVFEGNQEALKFYGVQVWDDINNGDVEIIQNNVLVGKWYAPKLEPKYDENNTIYYEIHLDYDSVLENEFHSPGDENE